AGGGARSERRRPESPAAPSGPEVEVIEPTRMQATIAKRMAEAKATVPNFNVTVEARVDEAVKLRQQLKESVPGAEKVTMTDMLMRACALALRRFPEVNSSWVDGRFQRKRSINIGLAVPPSQGLGLLVPVVHDVDRKDLVQISIESRQVIERARSGRPGEHDLSGATFSISNLGMYGVDEFVAIINPPESAILAVGAIKDVAVVEDGRIVPGKVMRMTLSVDHRVFYGQTAAQFMAEVKRPCAQGLRQEDLRARRRDRSRARRKRRAHPFAEAGAAVAIRKPPRGRPPQHRRAASRMGSPRRESLPAGGRQHSGERMAE